MQSKRQFQDQSGGHYKGLSTANGWIKKSQRSVLWEGPPLIVYYVKML